MEDILKETTNMIAGSFLSKLEASAAFKLQTPLIQALAVPQKNKKEVEKRLRFEVEEEVMELFVEKG
jgi:CheY-specific phosphatase CheX